VSGHRRSVRIASGALARAAGVIALCIAGSVVACGGAAERTSTLPTVDDFGDTLAFGAPATRVVSLNPVTTELLFALGLGDRLVGRTSFDLFPDAARAVTDVGNGMQPNVEAVLGQRPDLVLLYASTSNRLAAQQLRAAGVMTLTLRTDRIADLARITPLIAAALGAPETGRAVVDSVTASLDEVRAMARPTEPITAFWHIWDPPLMTIGGGSYLSELLNVAGVTNVFGDTDAPSPQVALEEVARRDPQFILASPTSAARIRSNPGWRSVRAVREGRVIEIDTTVVGRPGVRMGEAARYLRRVLVDVPPR